MKAARSLLLIALPVGAVFFPVIRPAFLLFTLAFTALLIAAFAVQCTLATDAKVIKKASPLWTSIQVAINAAVMAGLGWSAALGVYIVAVALVALLWSVALDRLKKVEVDDGLQ